MAPSTAIPFQRNCGSDETVALDPIVPIEKALSSRPDEPQFYNRLGLEFSRQELYREASDCFSQAVQLNPRNPRLWYNLGTATQACGDPDRALRYYRVALRLWPGYDRARRAIEMLEAVPATTIAAASAAGATAHAVDSPRSAVAINEFTVPQPGLLTRTSAALIDLAVVQAILIAAFVLINLFQQAAGRSVPNGYAILLGFAGAAVYWLAATARTGQTLGKRWLKLRVVTRHGERPGAGRAIRRLVGVALDALTVGLGFLWARFDRAGRALHDRIADTRVAGRPMDPGTAAIWISGAAVVNYVLFTLLLGPQLLG